MLLHNMSLSHASYKPSPAQVRTPELPDGPSPSPLSSQRLSDTSGALLFLFAGLALRLPLQPSSALAALSAACEGRGIVGKVQVQGDGHENDGTRGQGDGEKG